MSSYYNSFCSVTMATAHSPGAFLPFVDETLLKTGYIYMLLEFTIIKLR